MGWNADGTWQYSPLAGNMSQDMPGAIGFPGFNSGDVQGLSAPGAPTAPGLTSPNPFQYTSFAQAGGIGKYIGANAPLFSAGLNALSQGFGIYSGLKNLSLAKKSFGLQKEAYKTNLANQTQSYNTQVQDRIAGRSYATEAERQAALAAAQLPMLGG